MLGILNGILVILAAEAIILIAYRMRAKHYIKLIRDVAIVLSGLFFVLGLRSNVQGADSIEVIGWITLAGLAHVIDLGLRSRFGI